jgi:tetratricopeptide (TPR) repeat protein
MNILLRVVGTQFIILSLCCAPCFAQIIEENDFNDQLVEDFGYALNETISNEDVTAYLDLFSKENFEAKVDNGIKSKDTSFKRGVVTGMMNAVNKLPEKIILEAKDGYYDFISYRYDDKTTTYHALFRLYGDEVGINYHDYELIKNPDGDGFLFSDIYIYLSGENFSESLKRLVKISIAAQQNSLSKDFDKLYKTIQFNTSGEFKKSLEYANQLNGPVKNDKFFMILKTIIASNVSNDAYLDSLKKLVEIHGEDPTININKIDYYTYLQEYDLAKVAIEQLMDETKDDFLNLMMGNLYFEQGDFAQAQVHFKEIVTNYDDFFTGHASYLTALTSNKEYKKAIEYLDELVQEYDKEDLVNYIEEPEPDGTNIYDSFINTKAYTLWRE